MAISSNKASKDVLLSDPQSKVQKPLLFLPHYTQEKERKNNIQHNTPKTILVIMHSGLYQHPKIHESKKLGEMKLVTGEDVRLVSGICGSE